MTEGNPRRARRARPTLVLHCSSQRPFPNRGGNMVFWGFESLVIWYLGRQACHSLARCRKSSQRSTGAASREDSKQPSVTAHDAGAEKTHKRASVAAKADVPQQASSSAIRAIWCPPPSHHHTAVRQQQSDDHVGSRGSSSGTGSSDYLLPDRLEDFGEFIRQSSIKRSPVAAEACQLDFSKQAILPPVSPRRSMLATSLESLEQAAVDIKPRRSALRQAGPSSASGEAGNRRLRFAL